MESRNVARPRVLIVEDDPDVAVLIEQALTALDYECLVAADVDGARYEFRPHELSMIITDYQVPGGGAAEFIHGIREFDLDVPVLLISGRMDKHQLGEMIRESVDEYIEKPLDLPALVSAVHRLGKLGRQRRRTRSRAAHLLRISSQIKVGAATDAILQNLVQAVGEITPFQSAVITLVSSPGEPLKIEASLGSMVSEPVMESELEAAFRRGFRHDIASFIAGSSEGNGEPFSQMRARAWPWQQDDLVLVRISASDRLWGFLRVWNPADETRPSESAMQMLSLLGHNVANALENREMYRRQLQTTSRMRVLGEVVKTALRKSDVTLIKRMLTDVAVNRFGHSFACFIEKVGERQYVVDDVACRELADYGTDFDFDAAVVARLERIEEDRTVLAQGRDEGESLVRGCQTSYVAIPIYTRETLRHIFVVEDDSLARFSESDVLAYTAFADQIGLVWQTLLYQKYLENTATELNESYGKLKEANDLNLRLQEIVKRYVPSSTWESALQWTGESEQQRIEDVAECAVMFIDIVGFTSISERAAPTQIVELLNICFSLSSSIVAQSSGEVIKYIGDGMLAYFQNQRDAIRAADDLIKSQSRLGREIRKAGLTFDIALRVGVTYGPVILAHVGPVYHQDRTLLGDTVNSAARLEAAAAPGTALLDLRLLPEGDNPQDYGLVRMPSIQVRGKRERISVMTFARDQHRYGEGDKTLESHSRSADR